MTEHATDADRGETLQVGLKGLLVEAGLYADGEDPFRQTGMGQPVCRRRLSGGANNAVFRVDLKDQAFLLKQYFSDPLDDRDRFGSEVAFLKFAWTHGIRAVPQVLASSQERGLALLEFIDGAPVSPSAVSEPLVEQAAEFCHRLLAAQTDRAARSLPVAAEACFSIQGHIDCVEGRVQRLQAIRMESELHGEVLQFVQEDLAPRWRVIREHMWKTCQSAGIQPEQELAAVERCVSPSDFGFHNALLDSQGKLRFIDFEYAGWDDPAKLVGDFFCQVEVPVPRRFFAGFAGGIASAYPQPDAIVERIRLLFPVYQLKWCCIVLNEFLPAGRARREFSEAHLSVSRQPDVQLQKARRILEDLRSSS